ncbi:MAG: S8 family serine peptidase [Acidobacteriota bacterium]|nr:S8 family serine peptidase [Acidobacteriota bacterium]
MNRYILLRVPPSAKAKSVGPESHSESVGASPEPPTIRLTAADLNTDEASELRRDPEVQAMALVMPTRLIEPMGLPEAIPVATPAWGLSAVRADVSAFDGSGVTVAVLDTGIDATHAAFAGVTLEQRDFSGDGNGDINGHGTHCAGTIFGRDVAGSRIGVARGVTNALIGKVLGNNGTGSSEGLFDAMLWASQNRANVISMSLGFDFPGLVLELAKRMPVNMATSHALEAYRANLRMFDALMAIIRHGEPFGRDAVVVAASGNESRHDLTPPIPIGVSVPAAADGVVSVGAIEPSASGFAIARFSNRFPRLCAPGVGIPSAKPGGGLQSMNGTSMATPHVAGVAALWRQKLVAEGVVTAAAVTGNLLASTTRVGFAPNTLPADRGMGLVQAP